MKKKDVINLIKEKAEKIEIKDFSAEILSRVKKESYMEEIEEVKQPKLSWNLRKWLLPSLSSVLAVFMFFLVFGLFSTPVDVYAYHETVALSTLSSVSMIESKADTIDQGFTGILLANDGEDPAKVESEIPNLETFFGWAEQLLSSDESLLLKQETSDLIGYQYKLSFETHDLLDDSIEYDIYFNQQIKKYGRTFSLDGIVMTDDQSFDFYAVANDRSGDIKVTIKDQNGYEIEVNSSIKASEQVYRYQQKFQGSLEEEVEFKWINEGLSKRIEMAFSGRNTKGNYQIHLEQHMMRIQYRIDNQTSEEGELDVEIIQNQEGNFYGITVRVNGRPEFTYGNVRRPRGNPGNGRN